MKSDYTKTVFDGTVNQTQLGIRFISNDKTSLHQIRRVKGNFDTHNNIDNLGHLLITVKAIRNSWPEMNSRFTNSGDVIWVTL